jgi:hypothetical protein
MSENNINNFQTLIEQKRIIKKMFSNMLIAAGAPDRKAISDYRPVGIMWDDLLAQIKKEVGSGGGGVDTFLGLTDTPAGYGFPGSQAIVNATADGLEFRSPAIDTNTWFMPGVAFVATDGDTSSAVVGDGNKPYTNVNDAMDAADIVIIKPGSYFENIQYTSARDNKHVIAMDGVIFTGGGVYVYSGTTNVKFTGRAVMDSNFYNGLQLFTSDPVNIEFECKAFENSKTIMWLPNFNPQAKINFKADYLRSTGVNGGAYCVRMYGTAEATFNIRDYIETHYTAFHARSGFSGKLIVNCPETRLADIYPSNPYGNGLNSCLWLDSALDCEIVFNGDLVDKRSVSRNVGVINAANLTNSGLNPTVTINGDVKALNTQCVYSWYRSAFGKWILNGDIINNAPSGNPAVPIWTQMPGWGGAADQTWIIRGNVQANNRILVGMGKKFYVYSPFIYNADVSGAGSHFFKTNTGSAQQTEIYIYNTKFELGNAPGTGEIVTGDASLAGNIVNSVGVTGTEPTLSSVVVDAWAGYTQLVG